MKRFGILILVACLTPSSATRGDDAGQILSETGIQGGLVVHLGCGNGRLTAGLLGGDAYLVHGLDADSENVNAARQHIQSLGLYGNASVDRLIGAGLPYADNLVNLLVSEDLGDVSKKECLRVLAPGGVAYIKTDDGWTKAIKPRPDEIDEWTHHLHDPGGNPVANDTVVGPPQHLQWTAGPLWARSHGYTPSVTAMISSGGRLFSIVDETLTGAGDVIPSKWFLVARDAFSGVLLWKKPVPNWGSHAMSGLADTGEGISVGRFTMPTHAAKRLVAVGDTVYVTLGAEAPVSAIDAATGEVKRVFPGTERTDEILVVDDHLIVSINPPTSTRPKVVEKEDSPPPAPGKAVRIFDLKSGNPAWKAGPFEAIRTGRAQDPFGRLELVAGDGKVFFLTPTTIECYAIDLGEQLWQMERPPLPESAVRRLGYSGMYEFRLEVLVYHDGVLLLAQPEPNTHHSYHTMPGTLHAFDANSGKRMWSHGYGAWGHQTPPDVFVIGDTVWTHVNADAEFGSSWGGGFRAKDTSAIDYRIQALDLHTGELRQELSTKEIFDVGHHHRCYRNKSTERFLMASRRGVEFADLATGENWQNHWVRSGCKVGNLPCNGMVYVAPHPCGCYVGAKLTGFNALSPKAETGERKAEAGPRLLKGPVYGAPLPAAHASRADWPTYRHDPQRTGATEVQIPTDLKIVWKADLGVEPSAPVVANGKVLVAGVDSHSVHALDAEKGRELWRCTVGGRVPSPPTFHKGLALFGSADGSVYCVRVLDGAPLWRFRAAPRQRLVTSFGQLESSWPVPGVLVQDGACWFAAGRSSYLDGGIRVFAVEPATGKVLHEETIYSPDPETGKMIPETEAQQMAGVLNDIPSSDGTNVFLRQMNVSSDSPGDASRHLFTTAGFLDSTWFNRTFWKVGRAQTTGPMVLGDGVAFGVEPFTSRSRDVLFLPGTSAYRLRCLSTRPPMADKNARRGQNSKKAKQPRANIVWEKPVGIRITAMVRAADTLFVAGSPDVVDADDPHGAWEGRKGGVLAAYSTDNGELLAEMKLPAPPVWDGMAAAGGQLYLGLSNGTVVCMRP
jgi:outer membrane protein assembly factor BamB